MSTKILKALDAVGLEAFSPFVLLVRGEEARQQWRRIGLNFGAPLLALLVFVAAWSAASRNVMTKYGALPSPSMVAQEAAHLWAAHRQRRADEAAFRAEKAAQAAELEAAANLLRARGKAAQADALSARAHVARTARFSAGPSYVDQIGTSLKTVFAGFLVASLVAIPLGVLCGISPGIQAALNPLIQIFKPVSPLAWLPIVMICVGALYTTPPAEAWFEKSFLSSALTVALCSLWPTLANTALGVASVDRDHLNVARVLRLGTWTRVRKIVIPSALPMIFAGLRISLGVGWMVLIAAEMLAQNPGLGKFVWDMFQNGSSQTLAQIMVAVFTIGSIGFALDRLMIVLSRSVSYGATAR
ncbi:MAG: ABC transporter permease [Myxococcales bacterium]|jgi:nitrate/nitrite transport system permease protein|nr:ABC transporter permease [Myxococcales bacterium]